MAGGRVICVGIAVLDRIYSTPVLPSGDGKHFADGYCEVGGGPAANAAVTVQRLGGTATLWARFGNDRTADTITDELQGYGIDIDQCRRFAGCHSSSSAVAVAPDGGRSILNFVDPAMPTDPVWLPLDSLVLADAVLGDLRWPAGSAAAFAAARARGLPCILDADTVPGGVDPAAHGNASHILFSRPGLAQFSGTEEIEAGLIQAGTRCSAWIGVTDGADGIYWRDDGATKHLPAFAVEVVDTLGAGDVCHGAFALALSRGEKEADALVYASAAAALKCTRPGGRAGIPDADDLAAFLGEGTS